MSARHCRVTLALLVALASSSVALGQQSLEALGPDTPVARVGDRAITAGELLAETIQRYGASVLADLVADQQLEAACAGLGIVVGAEEVQAVLDSLRKDLGDEDYARLLERVGGEQAQRTTVRRELLFARWLGDRIEPTEDELRDIYDATPMELEEARALGILVATEQEANDLHAGVATPDNFESLAVDVSIDKPSAERRGDLGALNQLNCVGGAAAWEALLAAEPGTLVGPFAAPEGWWLLLRGETLPKRTATFEEMREGLTEQLRSSKLESQKLRWRRLVRAGQPAVIFYLAQLYALSGGPPPAIWVAPDPETTTPAPGAAGTGEAPK
jgi:parvulin-like peptidyl-prolyl isomerase